MQTSLTEAVKALKFKQITVEFRHKFVLRVIKLYKKGTGDNKLDLQLNCIFIV